MVYKLGIIQFNELSSKITFLNVKVVIAHSYFLRLLRVMK